MQVTKSVQLAYREAGSDKVYHAAIIQDGATYSVKVEWGRRGSVLSAGVKAEKVDLATAEKTYHKVVKEKTSKGYQEVPDQDGKKTLVGLQATGDRENLGVTAQLMNQIKDDQEAKLIEDNNWIAQRKYDGVRILAHVEEEIKFTNRKGEVTGINLEVEKALAQCPKGTLLDGEVIPSGTGEDSTYWVYDLLKFQNQDTRKLGYLERHQKLSMLKFGKAIKVAPYASGATEKRKLVEKLREECAEGAVFKKIDAPYVSGKPASGGNQLKLKFTKTADVFLTGFDGKAYQMAVKDADGNTREVGRVYTGTTVGEREKLDILLQNQQIPVIEVRYLYATEADILFQPVYVRLRNDKLPVECRIDQLVRTNREIED
jgi:bifunctional non-homologous end joining protein LigD